MKPYINRKFKINKYIEDLEAVVDKEERVNLLKQIVKFDPTVATFLEIIYSDYVNIIELPKEYTKITLYENNTAPAIWNKVCKKMFLICNKNISGYDDKKRLNMFDMVMDMLDQDEANFIVACIKEKAVSKKIKNIVYEMYPEWKKV